MQDIAIVGSKNSGKTATIEKLVNKLAKIGISIAVIKHISQPDFTIDTVDKDTWKYAKAGAKKIISVANMKSRKLKRYRLRKYLLKNF